MLSIGLAAGEDNAARTLDSLLKELRTNRAARQREREAAEREQQQSRQILRQKQALVSDSQSKIDQTTERIAKLKQQRSETQAKVDALKKRETALRNTITTAIDRLLEQCRNRPLLASDEQIRELKQLKDKSMPIDQLNAAYWHLLQTIAARGSQVQVDSRGITVDDQEIHADILRVGTVAMLWMTPDGSRGGNAIGKNGQLSWREAAPDQLKQIAKAIRVARRESPADIVLIPVEGGDK